MISILPHAMLALMILAAGSSFTPVNAAETNGPTALITTNGKLKVAIIVSEDMLPNSSEGKEKKSQSLTDIAVSELKEHLALIAEGELTVTQAEPKNIAVEITRLKKAGRTPLVLGGPGLDSKLTQKIMQRGTDPESFALQVQDGVVTIAGLSPKGTLNGVYEALEQLGFRWYMPGELGRVIPTENKNLVLKQQLNIQVPSFPARWLDGSAMKSSVWQRRTRMGGFNFPPSHGGVPKDVTNRKAIQAIADKIVKEISGKDLKTPHVITLGPPDRPGWFSDNEEALALDADDYDPFFGGTSRTDRLMWFYNEVLKRIDEQIPNANVRLFFYAYHDYVRPPIRKDEVDSRITPAFAPITLCRVHGMGEEICPEKYYYRSVVKGWHQAVPEVYVRGYYFNLAGPGVMFSMVHRMRKEIPIMHELGVAGFRQEVIPKWGSESPSLYIASRLMWNHTADVDALLSDFYRKFFGPAAEPMGKYLELMDAALRDTDHHTGSAHDVIHWYPAKLRAEATSLLDQAKALTSNDIYGLRVRAFRGTFDFTEALIQMIENRAQHQYEAAHMNLERMRELIAELGEYDPPMLHPRYSTDYLNRFFAPATEQAVARVIDGNTFVTGLADEWKFLVDHEEVGEVLGYWRPELTGGNWNQVRTSTTSWSNLGLRYYMKKPSWYRQNIELPESIKGRPVSLWFGGVDDAATVWVNGEIVGETKGAFKPFEFDVSDQVRPGETNVVVVKVTDRGLSELGTGGITAPAMFYMPKAVATENK